MNATLVRARDYAAKEVTQRIRHDHRHASERIVQMLRYIEAHLFDRGLNVQTLLKACHMRDNSLAIRFHQELLEPPKAYITARRMETASRLLAETDFKIWQIGTVLGFSSLGVFSKAFARWAGERPLAFRYRHEIAAVAPNFTNPELCRRALAGLLEPPDAERLIRLLQELYPDTVSALVVLDHAE